MCRASTAKQLVILVIEDDYIALFEQCVVQLSFAGGKWRWIVAKIDSQQGMLVTVLVYPQIALDRQADDRRRERRIVIMHLFDVSKRRHVAGLLAEPDIDGGLVGGASLDPASFCAIIGLDPPKGEASQ